MEKITITKTEKDGFVILHFDGTLGFEAVDEVEKCVAALLVGNQVKIVFDLAKVDNMLSAGLGVVAQAHKDLVAAKGRLAILNPSLKVKDLFRLTRMAMVLNVYDNEVDCFASFK